MQNAGLLLERLGAGGQQLALAMVDDIPQLRV